MFYKETTGNSTFPIINASLSSMFFQGANWKEHLCGKEGEQREEGGGSNLNKYFLELSQVIYFLELILILYHSIHS